MKFASHYAFSLIINYIVVYCLKKETYVCTSIKQLIKVIINRRCKLSICSMKSSMSGCILAN